MYNFRNGEVISFTVVSHIHEFQITADLALATIIRSLNFLADMNKNYTFNHFKCLNAQVQPHRKLPAS